MIARALALGPHRSSSRAFTLIELLVVVTIIVALLAILMPAMSRSIQTTHRVICGVNQRTISQVSLVYATDNFSLLPDLAVRPGSSEVARNLYWTFPEWREIYEEQYGVTRELWYSPSNTTWNIDHLYFWNNSLGANNPNARAATATHMIIGYLYFASSKGNSDWLYNAMLDKPPASRRPLFPVRLSDQSYFPFIMTDINREYPITWGHIDWSTPGDSRVGANHLRDGSYYQMPEGSHVARPDGSVSWTEGDDLLRRAVTADTELYW